MGTAGGPCRSTWDRRGRRVRSGGAVGVGDEVEVEATPETRRRRLTSPPPPGFVNLVGATATGLLTVTPMPASSDRLLAVNRFGELLRHAANGTDPTPQVGDRAVPVGTFDAAVGRYVHLDLGGVVHRIYFEEAGRGIGLVQPADRRSRRSPVAPPARG